jgi:hypothetical protein
MATVIGCDGCCSEMSDVLAGGEEGTLFSNAYGLPEGKPELFHRSFTRSQLEVDAWNPARYKVSTEAEGLRIEIQAGKVGLSRRPTGRRASSESCG